MLQPICRQPSRTAVRALRGASARARAYRLFAGAFERPDEALVEDVRRKRLAGALQEALGALDPALIGEVDWNGMRRAGDGDELAVEYERLFGVGTSGPPGPLCGGFHSGARARTMEEALRFYERFGLGLAEGAREAPDHLTTELEFLHYLAFREVEELRLERDAGHLRRAECDFLARHPGAWVPSLLERLQRREPHPFFGALTGALARFLSRARAG